MNFFKASEPKDETYVSSTRTDSIYVLGSNVRPIQSSDFASKDEEELAAQGKRQQTNVRSACHVDFGGLPTELLTEEFRLHGYLGILVHVDAYLGGHVHVSPLLPFDIHFSKHQLGPCLLASKQSIY